MYKEVVYNNIMNKLNKTCSFNSCKSSILVIYITNYF